MKTNVLIAIVAVLVLSFSSCGNSNKNAKNNDNPPATTDAAHNSRNSLDYAGTYTGTLPCADCSGIDIELILKNDSDYTLKTTYKGKEDKGQNQFTKDGKYTWNTAGSIITLNNDSSQQYQIGENMLIALDQNGQRMTGDLADMYILKKK
jgi:Uncharacterized lipoprotein NlpE involved in copper resistance